jgi:hypothetical protein
MSYGYWEDPDDRAIADELAEVGLPLDKLGHLLVDGFWTEVSEELAEAVSPPQVPDKIPDVTSNEENSP